MGEIERQMEIEAARAEIDFSKCQIDKVVEAYRAGGEVEWESISPYLSDYNTATGEMWDDNRLASHDRIGIAVAKVLRKEFPGARMISLYDEYNSGMPDDAQGRRGMPVHLVPQLIFPEATRKIFRQSVEQVLKRQGVIRPEDNEGEQYLLVSESEKVKDAETLVGRLEDRNAIIRKGEAIYFVKDSTKIELRNKMGRWQCAALDASAFLKPENREITHLVVLPKSFEAQQDQVWEILRALEIARPDTYHNIFFDTKLSPDVIAEVIRGEIVTQKAHQPAKLLAA